MIHYQTSREWKHNKFTCPDVRKSLDTKVNVDQQSRQATFTITTDDVDRDFDRVMQEGINLTHYQRNPVVLWEHDSCCPVGKCVSIEKTANALTATVEFFPPDNPAFGAKAEGIFQAILGGFLSATSVGFGVIDHELSADESRGAGTPDPGADFIKIDLFEFSIVSVPANPYALITHVAAEPEPDPEPLDEPQKHAEPVNMNELQRRERKRQARILSL